MPKQKIANSLIFCQMLTTALNDMAVSETGLSKNGQFSDTGYFVASALAKITAAPEASES